MGVRAVGFYAEVHALTSEKSATLFLLMVQTPEQADELEKHLHPHSSHPS